LPRFGEVLEALNFGFPGLGAVFEGLDVEPLNPNFAGLCLILDGLGIAWSLSNTVWPSVDPGSSKLGKFLAGVVQLLPIARLGSGLELSSVVGTGL